MASRLLLCIGCDKYSYLRQLNGAELDAQMFCNELTTGGLSYIKPNDATFLLSPNRDNVLAAFDSLLASNKEVESFTFFFAGHGALVCGSYYLCLVDTREQRMSATGLALSHLFEFINELHPAHCNLVIDACQAGGLVADIGTLLKPEIIGKASTSGVSIFASSAANQYASESELGGYGTSALIKVLRGAIDTGSRSEFLDLLDIGRAAARSISLETDGQQSPSVWGMNLYGSMPLYGNPHASEHLPPSLLDFTGISPASPAGMIIGRNATALLGLMYAPLSDLLPAKLYEVLERGMAELSGIQAACPSFIEGVHRALQNRAKELENSFAAAELTATCLALLLESTTTDATSVQSVRKLGALLIADVKLAMSELETDLATNPSSLAFQGIGDLYYLPQRIARILGWSEASIYIAEQFGICDDELIACANRVYPILFSMYGATLAGMSEAEVPFWLVFLVNSHQREEADRGEQVLGTLFNALVENRGGLARADIDPEAVLAYLMARGNKDFKAATQFRAQPSEALSMTLLVGALYSLQDVFDPELCRLDHVSINIFLPNHHTDFASSTISDGRNHVFQIGHGIWTIDDLVRRWQAACGPQLAQDASLEVPEVRVAALCASLVFPDRAPWFLLKSSFPKVD